MGVAGLGKELIADDAVVLLHIADLFFGKNGVASWGHKPFPPDYRLEGPFFAEPWN
jgi:hypothetical protein